MRSLEHQVIQSQAVSQKLIMTIRALGEFKGKQDLYKRQAPEMLETLRQVAMIQSTESSSRIEGVVVAPDRLKQIMAQKVKPRDRSEQEIAGYRDALAFIHTNAHQLNFTPNLIGRLHTQLYQFTDEPGGQWKDRENAILEIRPNGSTAVRFQPVSSIAVPEFMNRLCRLFKQLRDRNEIEPLLLIASCILDFECVHPFMDGNGRIGRLLSLLLLYQAGYEVGRYISLERIIEDSKETYYDSLYQSSQGWHQGEHDLRPWWEYFLGTLIAAYREFDERTAMITSARGIKSEMVRQAIERLPVEFSIGELEEVCPNVSRDMIRVVLNDLRGEGKVRCQGKGRFARWKKIWQ
ncbi:MAG: Fic family protein [Deltaproteobacteria bacterium]|nr:Fic family protein [Deltaproteobacteria bacterium]